MKMKKLKENKLTIIMFVIGLLLGLLIMSFNIKEKHVELKEEKVIVSFEDKKGITSDEYYLYLKENSGIDRLLDLIDNSLLSKKYQLSEDKLKEIQNNMQDIFKSFSEYYNTSKEGFLSQNGFKDEQDFENYLKLEELRKMYEEDYLKDKVTNNEINYYYINKMNKDFEIKYIKGNQETLEKILIDLKNNTSIEDIKKKYKKIEYKDLGYITFDDNKINTDIYADAALLDENSYTTSLRSIDDEYYIIFKGKEKDKDDVNKLKERIKNKIVLEKMDNDTENKLYFEALINLRKEKKINFYDTYLDSLYQAYLKEIK